MIQSLSPAPLSGTIAAIASKSHAHRLLICAALADQPTEISCPTLSQDISATAACLQALGADISYKNGIFTVRPGMQAGSGILPCGESGSTLRFLLPVAAALGKSITFRMEGRLPNRPLEPLDQQLLCHGVSLSRPQPDLLVC